MLRKYSSSYGVIILAMFFVLFLPKSFTRKVREKTASGLSPFHQGITFLRAGFLSKASGHSSSYKVREEDLDKLKVRNQLLTGQLEAVKEYLLSDERLDHQINRYKELSKNKNLTKKFLERREKEYFDRLTLMARQVPAKIVYRDPAFWSTAVWINVGKKQNKALGEDIITIDSPVVVGDNIVGVIDYVGESQSKVSLITDASLTTSVRIVRGSIQNKRLLDELSVLQEKLKFTSDIFFSKEEQKNTLSILEDLKENIKESIQERYLAKGELKGSSRPLWRSRKEELNGVGFNYDFEDVEGPARDLRTGESLDGKSKEILIKEGDLLVTSGMDGIFPAGFHAGIVTKVDPLEEGAISYSLEAKATCGDLNEITSVYVLKRMQD
ncbi:hypothetical protein COB11_06840 [Candidatus Aerophobetes bacterium]|uniref:Cell shape-determining protein MreC n=1 Tax=Aerophobetes bacterium TaxID=2030807 RepID=A0A2A4YDI9_UNCAE|nr:MAG: hypothetical protein COB11_06840 [Candidatus Aerophobetes bacterium]